MATMTTEVLIPTDDQDKEQMRLWCALVAIEPAKKNTFIDWLRRSGHQQEARVLDRVSKSQVREMCKGWELTI